MDNELQRQIYYAMLGNLVRAYLRYKRGEDPEFPISLTLISEFDKIGITDENYKEVIDDMINKYEEKENAKH